VGGVLLTAQQHRKCMCRTHAAAAAAAAAHCVTCSYVDRAANVEWDHLVYRTLSGAYVAAMVAKTSTAVEAGVCMCVGGGVGGGLAVTTRTWGLRRGVCVTVGWLSYKWCADICSTMMTG
jgi:hypothetical protein